ncbi:patatin-like phospholipase domain-containing protein [Parerythrobacter aestuarii]|uniref:hypothetical protein n=1 Tax=Parerythrobacter aestuarii TaxID=3020909 RepID=UPI0024DE7E15|nr:hypothetical protein [Parerythrobacter aestuarii]
MTGTAIKANVHATPASDPTFPEQRDPDIAGRANCAICFSGGGNRALASTAGQLRALTQLGLVNNARYISCVSGGSWASGAYTFLPGDRSDDEFLGPHVSDSERGDLSIDEWGDTLDDKQLVHRASVSFADVFWKNVECGPADMAWISTVREVFYEPFGLGEEKFMAASPSAVAGILAHNGQLSEDDFHTPRPGRPYLVVNGTLEWPVRVLHKVQRVLVQFTPGYVGNAWPLQLTTRVLCKKLRQNTGGGFLDSFAFGSTGPNAAAGSWLPMPAPERPFAIWHASGISSAAFGYDAAKYDVASVIPKEEYWAVSDAAQSAAKSRQLRFTDGGNLENFGLMAMLQRKVEKIVVFVDSEDPLPDSWDIVMDNSDVTPLFGLKNKGMPNNQVFKSSEYKPLLRGWIEAQRGRGLAMFAQKLAVQKNGWFGIDGGWDVEILWVYTAPVTNWIDQLSGDMQQKVYEGIDGHEPLAHFPNYLTADENHLLTIDLSKPQAALLADMYAWAIKQEADAFRAHLPPRTTA